MPNPNRIDPNPASSGRPPAEAPRGGAAPPPTAREPIDRARVLRGRERGARAVHSRWLLADRLIPALPVARLLASVPRARCSGHRAATAPRWCTSHGRARCEQPGTPLREQSSGSGVR
eukprot:scaffold4163_cov425-Prasinococcus_capsulatus_cf.AAC.16